MIMITELVISKLKNVQLNIFMVLISTKWKIASDFLL